MNTNLKRESNNKIDQNIVKCEYICKYLNYLDLK